MIDVTAELRRGRAAAEAWTWEEARTAFAAVEADEPAAMAAEDLQRYAESAWLTGHDDVAEHAWVRAHTAFLADGEPLRAARCAFWLGLALVMGRGDVERGGGWFARATRLISTTASPDRAEVGIARLIAALTALDGDDAEMARERFADAARIGAQHGDADLVALGRLGEGQARIRLGETAAGIALLDEVMVAVDAREVAPLPAGIVYCGVILACKQVADVRRAQRWTDALTRWCEAQPGLVAFRGTCLVHRAELAQLRGDWTQAVEDADHACDRLSDPPDPAAGMAFYQRAELHRLRGEHADAEAAYQHATARGHDPHPGLALLWLAQGRVRTAVATMRRVIDDRTAVYPPVTTEVHHTRPRAEALAAAVEVVLAADERDAAADACAQLEALADAQATPVVVALATAARGALLLAEGRPGPALDALVEARSCWLALDAPHETARVRVLVARALDQLGDADTAAIERQAAREVFAALGATPDLDHLDGVHAGGPDQSTALTPREVEVIRLVAAGLTNREIAGRLVVSDKTVARHLHNVFTKLDLPNRAAATAYAYEHGLV
ncbi:LuxR C-terminal-related transcriptional regulator [Euzebya sp.]|uniref:LuxR C-terminal-related transcriptional regulator n=1 Tax=Euzebya sp. TaxID=1971409 RepID=UPI0035197C05